jgi:hypothetical protein
MTYAYPGYRSSIWNFSILDKNMNSKNPHYLNMINDYIGNVAEIVRKYLFDDIITIKCSSDGRSYCLLSSDGNLYYFI